jgi:hypothetical protein
MRDKSKNIINKYITQPNTLIICVIPANTTRLTSNQALGMVNDANKTKDCIIALTMVDLLHNDDIEIFIDRILLRNNEIKKLNIKKIIGVISHKNKDINENIWFDNNLLNTINDNNLKNDIKKNISLENLLISVDEMFNDFISSNWKNDAINKTNKEIAKLENDYNQLGKDITLKELFEFIKTNLKLDCLITPDIKFKTYYFRSYLTYDEDIKDITNIYENYKNNIIKKINEDIENIFNFDDDYKYNRFEILKKFLKKEYTNIINNHYNHIDIWFNSYLDKFKYEYIYQDLQKFEAYIYNNFIRYIYTDLNNFIIDFNDKSLITESDEWITKRNSLNLSINKYKKHKNFFENL